jgi:hypothetical protein
MCWAHDGRANHPAFLATALLALSTAVACGNDAPETPGADAGPAATAAGCFAEDPPGQGGGTPECASLPYAKQACPGGADTGKPPGVLACEWFRPRLKASAFRQLFICLAALPARAEACSAATDLDAFRCSSDLQRGKEGCAAAPLEIAGQRFGCPELVDACTTNTAEQKDLTLTACNARLDGFNTEARRAALECYRASAATLCADRLTRCTTPPL